MNVYMVPQRLLFFFLDGFITFFYLKLSLKGKHLGIRLYREPLRPKME